MKTPRPTNRRQFKLWLIAQLRTDGNDIHDNATYAQIARVLSNVGLQPESRSYGDERADTSPYDGQKWSDGELERISLSRICP